MTDAEGLPLRFILTGGEAHYVTTAADLLNGQTAGDVIAEKICDSTNLREIIDNAGADAIILAKRKIYIPHDEAAYRLRNRIERFFHKLKRFRRVATRYDRRENELPVHRPLASCMIGMR